MTLRIDGRPYPRVPGGHRSNRTTVPTHTVGGPLPWCRIIHVVLGQGGGALFRAVPHQFSLTDQYFFLFSYFLFPYFLFCLILFVLLLLLISIYLFIHLITPPPFSPLFLGGGGGEVADYRPLKSYFINTI